MEIKLSLSGGDSRHESKPASAQERVNWVPERQAYDGATEEWILKQIEGSTNLISVGGSDRCRGLYKAGNGHVYGVWGSTVYEIYDSGSLTAYSRGTVASGTSPVWMADNGYHLAIADGNQLYLHELGTTDDITGASITFSQPSHVRFIGGYLIAMANGGTLQERGRFYYSSLLDATTWPALNYFTAEGFSDPLTAIDVRRGDVWLFGSDSYEVWSLTGDATRVFSRVGSSHVKIGVSGRYSVASIGDSILWIGSSKAGADNVYLANGYEAQVISDVTISQVINGLDVGDAIAWTYQAEGHVYYILQFYTGDTTLVYDLTTGRWHRRQSQKQDQSFGKWNCCYGEYLAPYGTICGFGTGGQLVYLSSDAVTEADGSPIYRKLVTTTTIVNGHPMMCRELRAYFDAGRTLVLTDNPQCLMRVSKDGGYTWSNTRQRSIGKTGAYGQSTSWVNNGVARQLTFELSVSDDCLANLIGLYADFEKGVSR